MVSLGSDGNRFAAAASGLYGWWVDADRHWQRLRGMRSKPPGYASKNKERQEAFVASLEQAEQLARRAGELGPETRPINLFYGLSQGTRAIAAALEPDDSKFWLTSHGIELDGSLNRSIRNIKVKDSDSDGGSFTRLATLLRSPSLPEAVALGDLLAALPMHLPASSWSDRPRSLAIEHHPQQMVLTTSVLALVGNLPVLGGLSDAMWERRRTMLSEYIAEHYPTLNGMTPLPKQLMFMPVGAEGVQFSLELELEDAIAHDTVREQLIEARSSRVGKVQYVVPAFGGATESCHPTVVLWAAMWALSMLARYAPVRWAKALDVDKSEDAVALEEVLQDAIALVPWCLVAALDGLPDWSAI